MVNCASSDVSKLFQIQSARIIIEFDQHVGTMFIFRHFVPGSVAHQVEAAVTYSVLTLPDRLRFQSEATRITCDRPCLMRVYPPLELETGSVRRTLTRNCSGERKRNSRCRPKNLIQTRTRQTEWSSVSNRTDPTPEVPLNTKTGAKVSRSLIKK